MREVTIHKTIYEGLWTDAIMKVKKVFEALKVMEEEVTYITPGVSAFFQNSAIIAWRAEPKELKPLPLEIYWHPEWFIDDVYLIQKRLEYDRSLYPIVGMLLSLDNPTNFREAFGALFKWGESGAFDSQFCKDHLTPRQKKVLPFLNKNWYAFFVVYFGEIADKGALKHAIEFEREREGKLSDYQKQALFFMKDILSYMDNKLATIALEW